VSQERLEKYMRAHEQRLLEVLTRIADKLAELSETQKKIYQIKADYAEKMRRKEEAAKPKEALSVQRVKSLLDPAWIPKLEIRQEADKVTVKPTTWLGKDLWRQINEALKQVGFNWISAEKESRWQL